MKRLLIILSLVGPAGLLLFLWLRPEFDLFIQIPLLHFYVVTFFTFTSLVVALFTAVALGDNSEPRHRLLATAFAVMGAIFLVHGVTTPEAIIFSFNPGISWAAWLTLFTGGVIFTIATFDTPQRPLPGRLFAPLHWALFIFCVSFTLIVTFAPHWLVYINSLASPLHQQTIFVITLLLWVWSSVRFGFLWWQTKKPIDGTMALTAAWLAIGSVSLHSFNLWNLSWWLYHIELVLGATTAVTILVLEYRQLRQFRLTHYYAAIGLIFTAALALAASHFFSRSVERNIINEITDQSQRIGNNLAFTFVCLLPPDTTSNTLDEVVQADAFMQAEEWTNSLVGLDIGVVTIFDSEQTLLYQSPRNAVQTQSPRYFQAAAQGESSSYLFSSEEPIFKGAEASRYLQTVVPLTLNEQVIGILSTVQDVPSLVEATIRARLFGLLIAGLSVGLLYAIMMIVVYRAEQIIITRTDELAVAYENLQAAEALRDDLTDMIVHDLRTPLTAMNLSVDLLENALRQSPNSELYMQILSRAKSSGERMKSLIEQILDTARLETGRFHLTPEPVQIKDLFQEKVTLFAPQADAENIQLMTDVPQTFPTVPMDKELISRVLDNLISNALKYTNPSGHITLKAVPNGQYAIIQVSDDGTGMDAEAAGKVFEKFYQIKDENGKPLRQGTGLGLTFCKLAVEAHHGRIWAESNIGEGSTFSFALPLSNGDLAD